MITAKPSFEQLFSREPRKVGTIEIYSSGYKSVRELENILKVIAKEMRIDLNNPRTEEVISVYIYPNASIFYSFFGGYFDTKNNIFKRRSVETMNFVEMEDGSIHMFFSGGNYKETMKILVGKIFDNYIEEKREKKLDELLKEELEPEEVIEEEELEPEEEELEEEEVEKEELESEEEIPEEEIDEIQIENADDQIEKIKEEKQVNVPEWLDLGWIMYKRGKLTKAKNIRDYGEHIKEKGVTSSGKISKAQGTFSEYNYADESAYAIVEYIIESYGLRKLVELFENPNIKETLGVSKEKFKRESKQSIKKRYIDNKIAEVKKEITDKENDEKSIQGKLKSVQKSR